jgi:hypothetical protein
MGKLLNAYWRSGALGKIGFWGSVASLVSLLIMFVPQNSGSQTAPEPQLHQDGHNQAIAIQGNDNKINLPDDKDEVAELIEILELRRIANPIVQSEIANYLKTIGLLLPFICTPEELLGEEDE